jgi:hypothetical protein
VLTLRSLSGVLWKQKLVSNVTNGKIAVEALGKETDNWAGQTIEVWAAPTQFGAKTVMGIEIAALNGRGAAQPALEATVVPPAPLPPAQTTPVPPAEAQPAPEATQAPPASAEREQINHAVPIARWDEPGGGDLDDEIPFGACVQ